MSNVVTKPARRFGLILSRCVGDRVRIRHRLTGEVMWITVAEAHGRVRLGFAGPTDWEIAREEVIVPDAEASDVQPQTK